MLGQSGARILIVSADLLDLALQIADEAPGLKHVLAIDRDIAPTRVGAADVANFETLLQAANETFAWGAFDETTSCGLCFTSYSEAHR